MYFSLFMGEFPWFAVPPLSASGSTAIKPPSTVDWLSARCYWFGYCVCTGTGHRILVASNVEEKKGLFPSCVSLQVFRDLRQSGRAVCVVAPSDGGSVGWQLALVVHIRTLVYYCKTVTLI